MSEIIVDCDVPTERAKLLTMVRSFSGKMRCSFKKFRSRRSDQQNRYLWGVVYPYIGAGMEELWGEKFCDEQVHEFCKVKFLSRPVVNRNTGECLGTVVDSSALLDTKQFADYLEKLIRFAAESLNVEIPEAAAIYECTQN